MLLVYIVYVVCLFLQMFVLTVTAALMDGALWKKRSIGLTRMTKGLSFVKHFGAMVQASALEIKFTFTLSKQ